MLSLAISVDQDLGGDVIEIEDGTRLIAKNWPQDSEANVVAHRPNARAATVVSTEQLAEDIARLLSLVQQTGPFVHQPDWYKRLQRYAS